MIELQTFIHHEMHIPCDNKIKLKYVKVIAHFIKSGVDLMCKFLTVLLMHHIYWYEKNTKKIRQNVSLWWIDTFGSILEWRVPKLSQQKWVVDITKQWIHKNGVFLHLSVALAPVTQHTIEGLVTLIKQSFTLVKQSCYILDLLSLALAVVVSSIAFLG